MKKLKNTESAQLWVTSRQQNVKEWKKQADKSVRITSPPSLHLSWISSRSVSRPGQSAASPRCGSLFAGRGSVVFKAYFKAKIDLLPGQNDHTNNLSQPPKHVFFLNMRTPHLSLSLGSLLAAGVLAALLGSMLDSRAAFIWKIDS